MKLPSLRIHFRGFTLIELMIAITIIAILAAVGFTSYSQTQKLARDSKRKEDLKAISNALELFYTDNRRFPYTNSTDAYYANSTTDGSNWIFDRGTAGTGTAALSPSYINSLPTDPLTNGLAWNGGLNGGYFYYAPPVKWTGSATSVCDSGQFYLLIAVLENDNDPDGTKKKSQAICGTASTTASLATATGAKSLYVIVRQ